MRNTKILPENGCLEDIKRRNLERMRNTAEKELNPNHYQLSSEAKKRLRWLYALYYEQAGNVTQCARKIGISRPWLSRMKAVFEKNGKDPRSLEPESKAPCKFSTEMQSLFLMIPSALDSWYHASMRLHTHSGIPMIFYTYD